MGKLDGKVALITGGSRGIGKAIAMAYAREGAKVFICARKRGVLRKAAEEIRAAGGEVRWYAADISKATAVRRLVRQVCRAYGTIHILVNNASMLGPREPVINYPVPAWEKVIKANLTAVFFVTKEVLGVMARQKEGAIINLSSGVGRIGKARWGAYAAAKFGVEGLTQVVAEEVKEWNIRVNAVNPGGTRTEMRAEAYPDEEPMTLPTPEEIAPIFVYLASDESREITGRSFDARDWSKI
ncbi:MAG: SDR family NAD(P)-dependent oxidoreductase [Deltaproteobacteria bacterium]|nr:SDR family NAD(P)-dependent oxidoreductase [Deltaproteobacteria bacterium]MBI2348233.1 SDR family NAD(P)-dependent oxidoreductase [Deltaproteobacteria bacterium]